MGIIGWQDFEIICQKLLCYLFVPPLKTPRFQQRTKNGHYIRDLIFPNNNLNTNNLWARLREDYDSKYIVIEMKNYAKLDITSQEVVEICHKYLCRNIGRFGILICSKKSTKSALVERENVYSRSNLHNLIIFLTKNDLIEMVQMKKEGQNPDDLIENKIINFELSVETY